jgi:hypothetical protein
MLQSEKRSQWIAERGTSIIASAFAALESGRSGAIEPAYDWFAQHGYLESIQDGAPFFPYASRSSILMGSSRTRTPVA